MIDIKNQYLGGGVKYLFMVNLPLLGNVYKNKLLTDLLENKKALADAHNGVNISSIDQPFLNERDISIEKRKILHDSIEKQYNSIDLALPKNLSTIKNQGTFTITTGHQLCLFGGPQYFIHKIISVISTAQKLKKKFPNNVFLPVFWLASEDHDFKEISSLTIFNRKLGVEKEDSIAVGKLNPSIFKPILNELKEIFKNEENFNHLENIFLKALKMPTWSQASRYWITHVFKIEDLIIIDADDQSLKELFKDSFYNELDQQFIHQCVSIKNNELESRGYQPKIDPRELNLFYLSNKKRQRIIFKNNSFLIGNQSFDKLQILEKLNSSIEKFSPNVLLRPLYQESILPNLVYIGGPSEIAYWTQLKDAFDFQSIPFPILMLRDHFTWLSQKQLDQWENLGFTLNDLIKSPDELIKSFLNNKHQNELSLKDQENQLILIETDLVQKASQIDQSLVPMVRGSIKSMLNGLNKINQKFSQSLKRNEEQYIAQIRKINGAVIENGVLKERTENFIGPFLRYNGDYIEKLIKLSSVESNSLKVLIY